MTVTVELLATAKEDLTVAVAAFETADDRNVSEQGRRLVEELSALDDVATGSLLASLKDNELRTLVEGSLRKYLLSDPSIPTQRLVRYLPPVVGGSIGLQEDRW